MNIKLFQTVILCLILCTKFYAQENSNHSLHLKIEPFELGYPYPRLGIGFEQKLEQHSVWGMFHYGWNGIANTYINREFDGEYAYWSIEAGVKKINLNPGGHFFIGARLGYDKTTANIFEDVFYDLDRNTAVLYDQATFFRSRISIFSELGQEFFFGKVSLEYYGGFGLRLIENWYANIKDPFVLNDIEPLVYRKRTQHKYVDASWKPALIIGIKLGYTISGSSKN